MSRPLTRNQALQNAAFLKALRRTGNVHEACRTLGVNRSTFTKRRAKHPAFAAEWDAALAIAHAALKSPSRLREGAGEVLSPSQSRASVPEPRPTRTKSGRLQLRRAPPRALDRAAEQAFLAALSATANVRLSAAAAGFSHSAFYHRRKQSPAFAREMRRALQIGYERVECALLAACEVEAHTTDAWRHNDLPEMPRMKPGEALQLLYLHQKEARLLAEPPQFRRRRGETHETHVYRLCELAAARRARLDEEDRLAQAARADRGAPSPHEPPPPVLPALDQVTGWSKASGQAPHHEGRALFGGWRLGDMKKAK